MLMLRHYKGLIQSGDGSVCSNPLDRRTGENYIELYSGCRNATEFQALQKAEQEMNIETFKEKGLSIRQIVRLAGISKGLVEKWLR